MKVSFPSLQPPVRPASRRTGTAPSEAPRSDSARPESAPVGPRDTDQWVHETKEPAPGDVPLTTGAPELARDLAGLAAAEDPAAGPPPMPAAPTALEPSAERARQVSEEVRRGVQAQPQSAAVHGRLAPATVLDLLA